MVRRSLLFSPGDRPEMLRKAPDSGADVVVFDLEDAVAPEHRADARETVHQVLSDPDFDPSCEVCVRVNTVVTDADEDLDVILGEGEQPDSVMLPKVEDVDDVATLARMLAERDAELPVIALIETARGVLNADEIADADPTDALFFGAEDLAADIGATRTEGGTEILHAREHVVLAASAAGIDAIDTVYTDFEDTEGLIEETRFAIQLGFDGKPAIHPAQVEPINEAFTPEKERIEWARRVLDAREKARREGNAVFQVDGEMIDAPLIRQAERIMQRARAADTT